MSRSFLRGGGSGRNRSPSNVTVWNPIVSLAAGCCLFSTASPHNEAFRRKPFTHSHRDQEVSIQKAAFKQEVRKEQEGTAGSDYDRQSFPLNRGHFTANRGFSFMFLRRWNQTGPSLEPRRESAAAFINVLLVL